MDRRFDRNIVIEMHSRGDVVALSSVHWTPDPKVWVQALAWLRSRVLRSLRCMFGQAPLLSVSLSFEMQFTNGRRQ